MSESKDIQSRSNRPQSPTELAQRLASRFAPDIPQESIQTSESRIENSSGKKISRRLMIKKGLAFLGVAGLGMIWAKKSFSNSESQDPEESEPKTDEEKRLEMIKKAVSFGFGSKYGPVSLDHPTALAYPDASKLIKPDRITPGGNPVWAFKFNFLNPAFTSPPVDALVVLDFDGAPQLDPNNAKKINISSNMATVFSNISEEELPSVFSAIIKDSDKYEPKVVTSGTGEDKKTEVRGMLKTDNKLVASANFDMETKRFNFDLLLN